MDRRCAELIGRGLIRRHLPRLVSLRELETMVVPGLLQTADYTWAVVINGASPGLAGEVVERRVLARMARQQVLTRVNPLEYHVIIEEAILERPVGTPAVMRHQLRRLIEEAATEHITLQVLPKRAGASPAMDGPFSVLTLPELGYIEGPGGAVYIEDREMVRTLLVRRGILTERALSPAESVGMITEAAKSYQ